MGATREATTRGPILLAGVGFTNMRDASVGPVLCERLRNSEWPAWVVVENYAIGAIEAIDRLRQGGYQRAIFFGSESRGGLPGSVRRYLAGAEPIDRSNLQECMDEAAEGVISLRTTIVLAGFAEALPADTIVFEVEPDDMNYGSGFSPRVEAAVRKLEHLLKEAIGADRSAHEGSTADTVGRSSQN